MRHTQNSVNQKIILFVILQCINPRYTVTETQQLRKLHQRGSVLSDEKCEQAVETHIKQWSHQRGFCNLTAMSLSLYSNFIKHVHVRNITNCHSIHMSSLMQTLKKTKLS